MKVYFNNVKLGMHGCTAKRPGAADRVRTQGRQLRRPGAFSFKLCIRVKRGPARREGPVRCLWSASLRFLICDLDHREPDHFISTDKALLEHLHDGVLPGLLVVAVHDGVVPVGVKNLAQGGDDLHA